MGFMVANTGRAASRAFYINLTAQPDLVVPPRFAFDRAVNYFIKLHTRYQLRKVSKWCRAQAREKPHATTGVVFHSVRPNLVYPFDSTMNVRFLSAVRDALEIDTVFFPVREPRSLFLSALNRQLARFVGNWTFPEGMYGWRPAWNLDEPLSYDGDYDQRRIDAAFSRALSDVDLEALTSQISIRTGKMLTLYRLFSRVFDRVLLFRYEDFIEKPGPVFEWIGEEGGFEFTDHRLVNTRINGLANRILLANLLILRKKKAEGLLRKPLFFRSHLIGRGWKRFRFEVPEILPLCKDWRSYSKVDGEVADELPSVSATLKSDVVLGVEEQAQRRCRGDDLTEIERKVREIIAPIFDRNFKILYRAYKENVHFTEAPQECFEIFWRSCRDEYEGIRDVMSSSMKRF